MNELLPDGWSLVKVGDAVTTAAGGVSVNSENRMATVGEFGVLKTSCVFDGRFYPSEHKTILKTEIGRATTKPKKGCILFSRMNTPVLVGQSGFIDKSYDDLFLPDRLWQLEISSDFCSKWLSYILRSQGVVKRISDAATGTSNSMKNIAKLNLMAIPIVCPPLLEQKKIAAILTSVDDVIEKTQAQIDKLNDLKTGMMQELLTRGVGVDGNPHTEFKDSPVGRIPQEWKVEALKEFTSFISYGFTNPMPEADSGPYMITAKDINNLRIQHSTARKTTQSAYDNLLTRKSRPEVNDLLLTKDGTLGRVALVTEPNCCINQSVAVITPNKRVIPKFLLYLLASPAYQQEMLDKAGGSTIKHIYITVVDKMPIAVPSIEEQEKLVGIFDSLFLKIDLAEEKLSKFKNFKKALMQDLLTGKVRVKVDS